MTWKMKLLILSIGAVQVGVVLVIWLYAFFNFLGPRPAQASESDRYKLLSKEVHERLSFSTYEYIGVSDATNSSARKCILVISRGERSARHPTAIEVDCPRE
jgi:hypothetical protein